MPVSKKKRTTSPPMASTPDPSSPVMPEQQAFRQYLRALAQSAVRTVVEAAGGKMQDITQITIFIRDRDDYLTHLKPLGQVHRAFFGDYYPATALFEISRFFQDEALIEIEGLAVISADE